MIDLKKLLNLEGAKALYDDLRERIAQRYVKPPGGIPAKDIASGVIPDSSEIINSAVNEAVDSVINNVIDDTAGIGNENRVWSADKTSKNTDLLAPKDSPIFTGSINMGRKSNTTVGSNSIATGTYVTASGLYSHAEGSDTTAEGPDSHAEGTLSTATGQGAHAEGYSTSAYGSFAHTEGHNTLATGMNSHAEGSNAQSEGFASHAEGESTIANGRYSHASGKFNVIDSYDNWNEWVAGTSYDVGDRVKRTIVTQTATRVYAYVCKTANSDTVFNSIKWTERENLINYAEMVGNGEDNNNRSNARVLDWDGNERLKGDIYVGCNADSSGGTKLPRIPEASSTDGSYILQATIASGVPTYSWTPLSSLSGVTF